MFSTTDSSSDLLSNLLERPVAPQVRESWEREKRIRMILEFSHSLCMGENPGTDKNDLFKVT